jgi:hypothetical protein
MAKIKKEVQSRKIVFYQGKFRFAKVADERGRQSYLEFAEMWEHWILTSHEGDIERAFNVSNVRLEKWLLHGPVSILVNPDKHSFIKYIVGFGRGPLKRYYELD